MGFYEAVDAAQFIGGEFRDGSGDETLAVLDPALGSEIARYASASHSDVDDAVRAASRAFPEWSSATPAERAGALRALARELDALSEELAQTETHQTGKPIRLSRGFDVPGTVDNAEFFAAVARNLEGAATAEYSGEHTSSIRREPIGVVGSISPWNYPLQMAGWKILPAIAAGNTVVLKPAEVTPLTSLMVAAASDAAGFPPGVVNVVNGRGPTAGAALIGHPDVAMVSFTGSTAVGKQIAATAAESVKRVHLELGGKAPFVVFDDADLDAAIRGAVAGSVINTGQDCTAATRAYVHRDLFDDFVAGVGELMDALRVGDPRDETTDLGPLVSARQQEHVAGFVDRARHHGATIVCGGRVPDGLADGGFFYAPTLVTGAAQDSEIVQREVFGPVLVALPFDDDTEAIRLANDTPYGLAASAWTTDVFRAQRASRELRAGCVWINDHIPIVSEMPHGGYKQSGYGKDMSAYSFAEYTQVKHVMSDVTGAVHKEWQTTVLGPR